MQKRSYFQEREIPEQLTSYINLVTDLRWTWSHTGDSVWRTMDQQIWDQTKNPHAVLQNLSQERLNELANDSKFLTRMQHLAAAYKAYCEQPGWYDETYGDEKLKKIAYFSMEFGLGEALPLYAGGLGILAGDYLKAASDLAVPVIAIGLLYQEGYFRQLLDANGWQQEVYPYNDSTSLPIQPVSANSGAWLHVTLDFPGRSVRLRVWQAQIGKVTLYLLDSNDPINSPTDRGITSKLYGGGQELRLMQEIALGIGGWRVIEALGLNVEICHLNEGHAAFVTLERARSLMQDNNIDFWQALRITRAGNVFTTHTPVAAGFDAFDPELILKYAAVFSEKVSVSAKELGALGRLDANNFDEPFNMAFLAMRTCIMVNGVSRLHGDVSRRIFHNLYPHWPQHEVPITHITNGIHVPSWDSPWADKIWTKACGKGRWLGTSEGLSDAINNLSDEDLWTFRGQERADLVTHVRKKLTKHLSQRGADQDTVSLAMEVLDPNVLTLGFARRFAEYKRPNLLLHDQQRLVRLLTNPEQPVQIIVAGKAHPHDETGKRFIQQWVQFCTQHEVRIHAVFLEDYDIALAQEMVQGVDVWINTPRRPWEACGTSGMKVLVNGGLNVSSLDGWWVEAYAEDVGWALGDGQEYDRLDGDAVEAEQLYQLLEQEIVPMFYQRDAAGLPLAWIKRIRASMANLAPQFSTNRMVREYVEQMYVPAAAIYQQRYEKNNQIANTLQHWERELNHHWHEIHWGNLEVFEEQDNLSFEVQVYLGDISPEFIQVQLFAEPDNTGDNVSQIMDRGALLSGATNGYVYCSKLFTQRPSKDFTPRIIAYHPQAILPMESNLILWWSH